MGTSASNRGTSAGSSIIPSWIDDLYPVVTPTQPSPELHSQPDGTAEAATSTSIPANTEPLGAPTVGSLRAARRAIGNFARTGDRDDLRKAVGNYTRKGLGGAVSGAKRLQPVAYTAGRLVDALQSARQNQPKPEWLTIDLRAIGRAPSMGVLEEIAREICPLNGTQDSEILQRGVAEALSILLESEPDAELGVLNEAQIVFLLQRFVALEIDYRIELDLGQNLIKHAPSAAIAMERQNEVRQYVLSEVESVFGSFDKASILDKSVVATKITEIISRVFLIFGEYFGE